MPIVMSVRANFADISGVQISHDICTRLARYLYSTKHSWIIMPLISSPASQIFSNNLHIEQCALSFYEGALGSFRNRTTLEKKIIQIAKSKKIRSKPKTACKTVKFDIFHILAYQNPNQCDTVVTREHTEVVRDKWRRIIAVLIEERQEKPGPK